MSEPTTVVTKTALSGAPTQAVHLTLALAIRAALQLRNCPSTRLPRTERQSTGT
jgi:hypothetical protein